MSMTIFDVSANDGKNYIYTGDSIPELELVMIFERDSASHKQFIQAANNQGSLVMDINNYPQAVERIGKDLADDHFTQVPELTTKKYVTYAMIGLAGLILLNMIFKK